MKFFASISLVIFLLVLHSCIPCAMSDCGENDSKFIQYISEADGSDLIFTGQYSIDSVKVTPMMIDPEKEEPFIDVRSREENRYLILLQVNNNTAGFIIQLASFPPDTLLAITGQTDRTLCCKSMTTFETAILNGDTLSLDRFDSLVEITK